MSSVRALLGSARFPTSIASDHEAQRQHASLAERRIPIFPPPLRTCARGTIASLPFDLTPTRSALNTYFSIPSPTLSRGTYYSRHDMPPPPSTLPDRPPAYEYPPPVPFSNQDDEMDLPSYSEYIGPCDDGKPFLLAKFLFRYGFCKSFSSVAWRYEFNSLSHTVCPPLWFVSVVILLVPLTPPPDWEPHRSEAERAALVHRIRATEIMWARRSLVAAGIVSCLISLIVVAVHLQASLINILFCTSHARSLPRSLLTSRKFNV